MTNDETIQVESILTYLQHHTNDDQSYRDMSYLERLCLNNTELTTDDKKRIIVLQERTIGYGKEK